MSFKRNSANAFLVFPIVALLALSAMATQNSSIFPSQNPTQPSLLQNLTSRLLSPSYSTNLCRRPCPIDDAAVQLVQRFEGYSKWAYYDAVGVKTVGFGHAIKKGEHIQEPLLPDAAQKLLLKDMASSGSAVNRLAAIPLRQNQFDALVSLHYNVGERTVRKSTLLRKLNAGSINEVPPQFLRYVYAGKKKLPGLVTRRQAESLLFADN